MMINAMAALDNVPVATPAAAVATASTLNMAVSALDPASPTAVASLTPQALGFMANAVTVNKPHTQHSCY